MSKRFGEQEYYIVAPEVSLKDLAKCDCIDFLCWTDTGPGEIDDVVEWSKEYTGSIREKEITTPDLELLFNEDCNPTTVLDFTLLTCTNCGSIKSLQH